MDSVVDFYKVSSLAKVFDSEAPEKCSEKLCGFKNEVIGFQVAVRFDIPTEKKWPGPQRTVLKLKVNSPIADYISIRKVVAVPSNVPAPVERDEHYLKTESGLFPDVLRNLDDNTFILPLKQWHSLWVEIDTKGEVNAGDYPISIALYDSLDEKLASIEETMTVFDAVLPKQRLIYTQWFHADCLADYYKVEVFGDEHWHIIERFVKTAVDNGVNMIFTSLFTPPIDTSPEVIRTVVQLLHITVENGEYRFDFSRLKKWVDMCKRCGIEYFEINHLFSQWGADFCPNIFGFVNGEMHQLFGMKTPVTDIEYHRFLATLLPQLINKLCEWGLKDKCWFHISDEPGKNHLKSYLFAKKLIEPYLGGFPIIDALSDVDFYKYGVVKTPVCTTDHIEDFLPLDIPELWAYYCGGQSVDVSNRFMSMPSYRNRIIGIQLYKFSIRGFLHWGYNFYNSALSLKHLSPYEVTDADFAFASGDAFSVYPGKEGNPEESIRARVFLYALQDMRAFELLESLTDKESVVTLLEEGIEKPITFKNYPHSDDYILNVRQKVNQEIIARCKMKLK